MDFAYIKIRQGTATINHRKGRIFTIISEIFLHIVQFFIANSIYIQENFLELDISSWS